MMPLTMADIGTQLLIKKINGRDDTKRFLESLGFVTGSQVMVISKFGGNFIVNVKDTRVAIDESIDVYKRQILLHHKCKLLLGIML